MIREYRYTNGSGQRALMRVFDCYATVDEGVMTRVFDDAHEAWDYLKGKGYR